MNTSKFDHLPDELKEQVIKAKKAFFIAQEISERILEEFNVCDLRVSATFDKIISISGIVESENEKNAVQNFVLKLENVLSFHNGLIILTNSAKLNLIANGKEFSVTNLTELKTVLKDFKEINFVEYSFFGHNETTILLLKNSTTSFVMYLRFNGDSGFTSYNPKGKTDQMKDFILTNGQKDEYPTSILVDNKEGLEVLKYFLLTGKMYPGIEWKEE